jgi:Fe-S-cluster containining protein
VGHLFEEERERIDRQAWEQELGVAPYVRVGRGWALNKTPDGACVFLDEDNRCMIHAKHGEDTKPLACRIFPFSVRPVTGGWQASLRFDCPSVTSSQGRPIVHYRPWLAGLAERLEHATSPDHDLADLRRGLTATIEELDMVVNRFVRWLKRDDLPVVNRLIGGARITTMLTGATLEKVRGQRFGELLDLLFKALPAECQERPAAVRAKQRGMLRQLAFAHAEHVSLAEMRAGMFGKLGKRWRQLRMARRFLRGSGHVPPLPGFEGPATFEAVASVNPADDDAHEVDDLLCRYLFARLQGRSVFGKGYYDWAVFSGLAALWLSVAAAGWLGRYAAATAGGNTLSFDDLAHAFGVVDRAATRLPSLGTMAERTRVAYLLRNDGVARLVSEYRPV